MRLTKPQCDFLKKAVVKERIFPEWGEWVTARKLSIRGLVKIDRSKVPLGEGRFVMGASFYCISDRGREAIAKYL